MPPTASGDARDREAKSRRFAVPPLGWPRLVLLVVLLNAPMFFQGCESQKLQFTLGPAVPFAQIEAEDQQPLLPTALVYWSWPKLLANLAILGVILWLATRVAWGRQAVRSRWFLCILLLVAIAFDLWLIWPPAWQYLVWTPQNHICVFILRTFTQGQSPSESVVWWVLLLSGRLYYLLLIAGLSLSFVLTRLFLRRYFFVRAGSRWQIQLGGLVVAMLILGAGVGMAIRLLMQ